MERVQEVGEFHLAAAIRRQTRYAKGKEKERKRRTKETEGRDEVARIVDERSGRKDASSARSRRRNYREEAAGIRECRLYRRYLAVTRSCRRKCGALTIPRFTITVCKVRSIVHDRMSDSHSAVTAIDSWNRQSNVN